MTNLARNLGGSLGIASISIILSRRSQFHQQQLVANLTGASAVFHQRVGGMAHTFMSLGQDRFAATQRAYGMIYGDVQRQAAMLGYIDAVYVFACVLALMTPAAFLMKKVTNRGPRRMGGH
jgi:DHA2 family multidrug resistance protein